MANSTTGFSMLMVILKLLFVASRAKSVFAACESFQYAEYGQKGLIECNFMSGFTGVYWYLHVETGYQIIIRLEKQDDGSLARSGAGYIEKTFDILSNGSLIVSNVSYFHNQSFKVVHVDEDLRVEEIYVELVTSILPDLKFPLINACNGSNLCFVEDVQFHILTCSFHHSKPAVNLTWSKLSSEKSETLQGKTIISEDGEWTFSSELQTNISSHLNGRLAAFSCRAFSPALKSHLTESIVIVDTTKQPWSSLEGRVVEENYFISSSEAKIHCTDIARPHILVWKEFHRHSSHVLGFAANGITRTVSDHEISHDGSLTFARVKLEDEGLYWCKISDGIKYESKLKQVKVFVPPVPPEIIVVDCPSHEEECEILIQDAPLRLSCYLNGVYPNVTLNMETTSGRGLRIINQTTYRTGRGNLFNATITMEISPMDCSTSLIIRCQISNPVSLDFIPEKIIVLRSEECKDTDFKVAAVVVPVILVLIIVILVGLYIIRGRKVFPRDVQEDGTKEKAENLKSETQMVPSRDYEVKSVDLDPAENLKSETQMVPSRDYEVKSVDLDPVSEKESMLKESVSMTDETETPRTEEMEDAMVSEKESMLKHSESVENETETPRTEELKEARREDRTPSLLQMLEETLHLLMSFPLNNATENHKFKKEAIKIVRDNPVEIQLRREAGTFAQFAGGALTVTGAALALFTFGFGAVLMLAGAAVGLTGFAIGFSSKELFENPSKWRKVKPAFTSLIKLLKSITQTAALAGKAHEAVANIKHGRINVHKDTLQEACNEIKILIKEHKNFRLENLNQINFIECLSRIKEDMEQLLRIMKTTYTLTSWDVDTKVTLALERPFLNLDADALTCIAYYDSVHERSGFISFIKMFFTEDQLGETPETASLEDFLKKTTKKTITAIAAAGIVLRAAGEEIDLEFLGTDLKKILGKKEEYTVALSNTANLMEKINTTFENLSI